MDKSHNSDKKSAIEGSGSIPTNFAYFKLKLYLKSDDSTINAIDLLVDFSELEYQSGGHILTNPQEPRLFPLVQTRDQLSDEKKRCKASITRKTTELSKLAGLVEKPEDLMSKLNAAPQEVRRGIDSLAEANRKLAELTELENTFEEGNQVFAQKKTVYSDFKRQMYDPEQIIARLIDYHLMRAVVNSEEIILCGKRFSLASVIRIGLHLHSRLDLCPYCVMFLHEKTKKWNQHIFSITGKNMVSTFVSSRQEYISSSSFLLTQPFYKGSSMRYIGLSDEIFNGDITEEKLVEYSTKGFVIQFLFSAHDLYTRGTR